jgi:membrane protease YdiL (CAAX protease family)
MKEIKDGTYLLFYLILITTAEISVSYLNVIAGVIFHFIILSLLLTHYLFISKFKLILDSSQIYYLRLMLDALRINYINSKNRPAIFLNKQIQGNKRLGSLLLALTLAPLIRIMSLVLPLSNFAQISWFIITGVAVYLAFIVIKIQQKIELKDCGVKLPKKKHLPIELGIMALGVPMGFAEYFILKPDPIIQFLTIKNIILVFIIFLVSISIMEEIVFRGLLQNKAIDILGKWKGILFITFIFASLHIGNLSVLDCILVFSIGLLYALVVYKTKTIIGVTISHTVVNMFLFVICPIILA